MGSRLNWAEKSSHMLAIVGSFIMLLTIFLFVLNIILRYFFQFPISGFYEISQMLMVLIICFGFAYAESEDGHINITMFTEKMPLRIQQFFQFFTRLLSFFTLGLLTWAALQFAIDSLMINGATPLIRIPIYPFALLFALGWLLMVVVIVFKMIGKLRSVSNGR